MLAIVWVSFDAYAGDCTAPARAEQVGGHVEDAMLAFATLDEDGFRQAAQQAGDALPCLVEVLPRPRAAAFHRMAGVQSFLDGDPEGAQRSFAASLAIEPDYALSAKIAPEGGKLWRLYDGSKELVVSDPVSFPTPRGPTTYVDGAAASSRVPELPAIVQVATGTKATFTVYVGGGEPVPTLAGEAVAVVEPVDAPDLDALDAAELDDEPLEPELDEPEDLDGGSKPPPKAPAKKKKGGNGAFVAAGVTGAIAGGLFATSAITRTSFDANPTAGKYYVTNGAYLGSVGLGVVAAGLAISGTF